MQWKILIIDDEKLSREYIGDLTREFDPSALVVEEGTAQNAAQYINELKPDIIFLDIEMPEMDAFMFLDAVPQRNFELVFITAYSQYAIKAIKEGAVDYLLKPVKKSEFKEMLDKVMDRLEAKLLDKATNTSSVADAYLDTKLSINNLQRTRFITLRDVVYLQADNTYTTLFMSNGEKIITTKPIHRFEKILNSNWFFRIHKSYIIGLHHFKEYISKDGNIVLMSNGHKLILSRYRLSKFLDVLRNISVK